MTTTETAPNWTEMLLPMWAVIADPDPVPGEPQHLVAPIEYLDADAGRIAVDIGDGERNGGGYVLHTLPWAEVLGVFPARDTAEHHLAHLARPLHLVHT